MQVTNIPLSAIEPNAGQLAGLPTNPRYISEAQAEKLLRNIKEHPDFLQYRALIVIPNGDRYVCVCGNQRLAALRQLEENAAPCMVMPADTPTEEVRAMALLDNSSRGQWDFDTLKEWQDSVFADLDLGLASLSVTPDVGEDGEQQPAIPRAPSAEEMQSALRRQRIEKLNSLSFKPLYYQPKAVEDLTLAGCINNDLYSAKVEAVNSSNLPEENKRIMRIFCERFRRIDFEGVANYYAFYATEEERKVMQRLRLVLVDDGSVNGFIEDGLLKVYQDCAPAALTEDGGLDTDD